MNTNSQEKNETSNTSWFRRLLGQPAPGEPTPSSSPRLAKKPVRHLKVLVVDDDPLFLKLAATHLESVGYDVVTATDGCEAIEAARKQHPNLVVLDVNLPQDVSGVHWDGFRVIEWMQRFEGLKNIPVVMTTAGDPSKYTRQAVRAGAKAFYHKRTDQNHLVSMVKQCLGRLQLNVAMGPNANFQI